MPLDETGLGADSLDRLKLATALAEAINLQRSGVDDKLLSRPSVGLWIETAAHALTGFSAELTFQSSGSTGGPKWAVHALRDLSQEIDVHAARFAGSRRVISAVPSHHIYGFLFTVLLPVRLRAEVVDVRMGSPARLAAVLRPGDLIVAHPMYWAAFVRARPAVAAGVRGVTSTAPCPPDVARAVTANGIESLTEVYGSSETAGIAARNDPAAPYELFTYWRRGPTDGQLIRRLPDGSERSVEAPDRLIWDGERHVRPAGRNDGAVQIGGQNVYPERVRAELCRHPGVADAAVRPMRPAEGDRLKAFVVPRDPAVDTGTLRESLWAWIDAHLTAPERPASLRFGSALPTGATGKRADWPI